MAKKKDSPPLCRECMNWETFNEKCFFYWHEKKECANHTEGFQSIKEHFEINSINSIF